MAKREIGNGIFRHQTFASAQVFYRAKKNRCKKIRELPNFLRYNVTFCGKLYTYFALTLLDCSDQMDCILQKGTRSIAMVLRLCKFSRCSNITEIMKKKLNSHGSFCLKFTVFSE